MFVYNRGRTVTVDPSLHAHTKYSTLIDKDRVDISSHWLATLCPENLVCFLHLLHFRLDFTWKQTIWTLIRLLQGSKNNPLFVWGLDRKIFLSQSVCHHSASLVMPNGDLRDIFSIPSSSLTYNIISQLETIHLFTNIAIVF